jgi:hypothetical protein
MEFFRRGVGQFRCEDGGFRRPEIGNVEHSPVQDAQFQHDPLLLVGPDSNSPALGERLGGLFKFVPASVEFGQFGSALSELSSRHRVKDANHQTPSAVGRGGLLDQYPQIVAGVAVPLRPSRPTFRQRRLDNRTAPLDCQQVLIEDLERQTAPVTDFIERFAIAARQELQVQLRSVEFVQLPTARG